jgi:hypothetical protein
MRMITSIAIVGCLLALAAHSLADDAGAPQPGDPAKLTLQLQLPDGNAWTLGAGGIGRPFMARLLLINPGQKPVRTWGYSGPEGAQCPSVTLTDEKGRVTTLRPPAEMRLAGVPVPMILQPAEVVPINLELLRLIGEHGLPPGKYKIQAFYENSLKDEPPFVTDPIWTGRIQSQATDMTIVAPKVIAPAAG